MAQKREKNPTLTAEAAEAAEKTLGILGDLCVLHGKTLAVLQGLGPQVEADQFVAARVAVARIEKPVGQRGERADRGG